MTEDKKKPMEIDHPAHKPVVNWDIEYCEICGEILKGKCTKCKKNPGKDWTIFQKPHQQPALYCKKCYPYTEEEERRASHQ